MATGRSRAGSCPRNTTPMPPAPSVRSTVKAGATASRRRSSSDDICRVCPRGGRQPFKGIAINIHPTFHFGPLPSPAGARSRASRPGWQTLCPASIVQRPPCFPRLAKRHATADPRRPGAPSHSRPRTEHAPSRCAEGGDGRHRAPGGGMRLGGRPAEERRRRPRRSPAPRRRGLHRGRPAELGDRGRREGGPHHLRRGRHRPRRYHRHEDRGGGPARRDGAPWVPGRARAPPRRRGGAGRVRPVHARKRRGDRRFDQRLHGLTAKRPLGARCRVGADGLPRREPDQRLPRPDRREPARHLRRRGRTLRLGEHQGARPRRNHSRYPRSAGRTDRARSAIRRADRDAPRERHRAGLPPRPRAHRRRARRRAGAGATAGERSRHHDRARGMGIGEVSPHLRRTGAGEAADGPHHRGSRCRAGFDRYRCAGQPAGRLAPAVHHAPGPPDRSQALPGRCDRVGHRRPPRAVSRSHERRRQADLRPATDSTASWSRSTARIGRSTCTLSATARSG